MKNNNKTVIERMMNNTRKLSRPTKELLSAKIGGKGTWMTRASRKQADQDYTS